MSNSASAARSYIPAKGPWLVALISASILVLELAFIRQVPAEVRAISYFTNLILMASFFGLGLGCILQEKRPLLFMLPLGLAMVFAFILVGRGIVIYAQSSEVHYWLGNPIKQSARSLPLVPAAAAIFIFAALPFITLGQLLAQVMDQHPKLVAYGWNIAGSLAGTVIFAIASYLTLPPWIWPPILMVMLAAIVIRSMPLRAVYVAFGLAFLFFARSGSPWKWSPYYYVQYDTVPLGTYIWVNSSFHQLGFDFNATDPAKQNLIQAMKAKWDLPYKLYRNYHHGQGPRRVLVLGAGLGNDVNIALMNGAQEVVAVEIDPVILGLGKKLNTLKPYQDPKVRAVVDDARHFLATTHEKFDLIVFGTIDSQSLLSGYANLRLENFVYTRESLADARQLLNDTGMAVIHYAVLKPWLYGRIYSTFRDVFGDQSRLYFEKNIFLFNASIVGTKGLNFFRDAPDTVKNFGDGLVSTDDWPFIYMERPTISPIYQELCVIILALIAAALVLLRRTSPARGTFPNFLLLGAGFTLMESSAVVRLALVFGSTWIVNAVVFSAILVTIFIGNLLVLHKKAPSLRAAWPLLFAAIVLNYFFPLHLLFLAGPALRVVLAGALIGLPFFFASLCFSHLFQRETITGFPLGINMVGAMAGGLVEYLSMITGLKAVWLIALCIYMAAYLASPRLGQDQAAE
jgi:hypothetical protein